MYSPRVLLFLVAALWVVNAAILQNTRLARSDLLDDALNPTGDANGGKTTGTDSDSATTPTSSSPSPSSSSSSSPPSSSSSSSSSPTETPTETPTSSSTSSPTAPDPSSTSTSAPASTPTSSSNQPPSTSNPEPTSAPQQTSAQPTQQPGSSQQPAVSTVVATVTFTSTNAAAASTNASKTSSTPGLNSDKDSATSSMPPKTRNTIIGVVVGIGGAILLGAVAMVAYRIWGRKKHSDENDGLMSYDMGNSGYEKHEPSGSVSGSQRTPFQSTLENYHQPSHVNASSNF